MSRPLKEDPKQVDGKQFSFYLSFETYKYAAEQAKKQDISVSKYVANLIKQKKEDFVVCKLEESVRKIGE